MAENGQKKLRHVVMFRFKADTPAESVKEVEEKFASLPGRISEIVDFEWGTDVSIEGMAQGFTHLFFVSFADEAGRAAYLPHPAHQEFVALVRQHKEHSLVFDFWAQGTA